MNETFVKNVRFDMTPRQAEDLFREILRNICGDYRVGSSGVIYDMTWCGDPSCGGHERQIVDNEENKLRLAAIRLMGLLR